MNAISHRAFFGDAEQVFTFDPPMIRELESLTGVGIGAIFARLASREFRFDDLGNVIRLGLIGGGMEPEKAARLVKAYVEGRPIVESYPVAVDIITTLWIGKGDDITPAPAAAPDTSEPAPAAPVTEPAHDTRPIGSEAVA